MYCHSRHESLVRLRRGGVVGFVAQLPRAGIAQTVRILPVCLAGTCSGVSNFIGCLTAFAAFYAFSAHYGIVSVAASVSAFYDGDLQTLHFLAAYWQ